MYPHDPVEDFFEIYGNGSGVKMRNGEYIYYYTSLTNMNIALDKLLDGKPYNKAATSLLHSADFVIKDDGTIIKNRYMLEQLLDHRYLGKKLRNI